MKRILFKQVMVGQVFTIDGTTLVKVAPLVGVPVGGATSPRTVVYPMELVTVRESKPPVRKGVK
jgi:hypothetical protein